jgi:hypothetical protein
MVEGKLRLLESPPTVTHSEFLIQAPPMHGHCSKSDAQAVIPMLPMLLASAPDALNVDSRQNETIVCGAWQAWKSQCAEERSGRSSRGFTQRISSKYRGKVRELRCFRRHGSRDQYSQWTHGNINGKWLCNWQKKRKRETRIKINPRKESPYRRARKSKWISLSIANLWSFGRVCLIKRRKE